jgi:hypothetical protein
MNIGRWPTWLRWLLFLPAAGLGTAAIHFALTIAFSGNEDEATIFGIGIEGSIAHWMNAIKQEGLMRFLEPWAFVAAGGVFAPARVVPSILLAAGMAALLIAVLAIQLTRGAQAPGLALLRASVGVVGAVLGAVTAIRQKAAAGRPSV